MIDLVFFLLVFLVVGTFFLFIHLLMGKAIRPNRPDPEKMTIYECGEPTVGSAWIQFDLRYYVVALLFVVFDVEVAFFFPWAVVFGKTNEMSHADEPRRAELTKQLVPAELNLVHLERERPKAAVAPEGPKGGPGGQPDGKGLSPGGKGGPAGAKGNPDGPDKDGPAGAKKKGGGKAKGDDAAKGAKKGASGLPGIQPGDDRPGGPGIDAPQVEQPGGVGPPAGTPMTAPPKPKPPDVKTIDQQTARTWAWIAFGDIAVFFGVLMVGFAYLWKRGDIDWVRSTAAEQ